MRAGMDPLPPRSEWQRWIVWLCTGDMPRTPQKPASFNEVPAKSAQALGPTADSVTGGSPLDREGASHAIPVSHAR